MGVTYSKNGEGKSSYRVLEGKPEEKMPVCRPRLIGKNNIKIDLRKRVRILN